MKKLNMALAVILLVSMMAFGGTKNCTVQIGAVAVGNVHSPNDLHVIDKDGKWVNLGFYDNSWVKGYLAVVSIALSIGHNIVVGYNNSALGAQTCDELYSKPTWISTVMTAR